MCGRNWVFKTDYVSSSTYYRHLIVMNLVQKIIGTLGKQKPLLHLPKFIKPKAVKRNFRAT